jgi:hypothetical protein
MKNKIVADSWYIAYHQTISDTPFMAKIDYKLADESNSKSHRFATFEEAYQWIKNQVAEPKKTPS